MNHRMTHIMKRHIARDNIQQLRDNIQQLIVRDAAMGLLKKVGIL